jgi:transposase-like protein
MRKAIQQRRRTPTGGTGKPPSNCGLMETEVPWDREGAFKPQITPKHQREWRGFGGKILPMYGLGLTTRQIQGHLKEVYNADVSPELISRVTDEVKGLLAAWRGRALEPVYPALFLDALRSWAL